MLYFDSCDAVDRVCYFSKYREYIKTKGENLLETSLCVLVQHT